MKKIALILLCIGGILSCGDNASTHNNTVRIVVSGNNRAALEPCGCRIPAGGLARKAGFIRSMEKGSDTVVKLESGNWLFPAYNQPENAPESWKKHADFQARAYQEMKYDVINVGYTDLSYGYDYLLRQKNDLDLPFISANLMNEKGELVFRPFYILKKSNLRIAVIGVIQLLDNQAARFPAVKPEDAIRKQLPKIRKEADLILVLADMSVDQTEALGETIPEIDFIINSRFKGRTQLPRQTGGKAAYTYLGPEGQYLGVLDVVFRSPNDPIKDLSAAFHRLDFSQSRLDEYRARAGDTPVESYYRDTPGLLRTIQRYEKEVARQQTIIDTTQNYMHWSMRILDGDVYSHPEWEKAVNQLLLDDDEKK